VYVDAVVLTDGRDDDPTVWAPAQVEPLANVLPTAVRDALPQLFVEAALPLALIDAEGRLLTVNSGFCALIGRPASALAGARLGEVVHPDDRVAHLATWHALLGGITRADRVHTRIVRGDGGVVPVAVYRTVVSREGGRQQAIGLAALHEETAPAIRGAGGGALAAFAARLAAAGPEQNAVGTEVARTLADVAGDAAWVWYIDDERVLRLVGSWHRDSARRTALAEALAHPISATNGALAQAVGIDQVVRLAGTDLAPSDPLSALLQPYANDYGLASLVLLPISAGDRVIGVLGLVRDGGAPAYQDQMIDEIAALTSTAALGLETASSLANARADERFARAVLDAMPVMAAVLDHDGRIVDVNAAWLQATDSYSGPLHTGIGENYLHLWDTAAATGVVGAADVAGGVRDVLFGVRTDFAGDCTYPRLDRNGDPSELWFHVHATQLAHRRHAAHPMVVVDHQDITDRKRLEVRLSYEATHDPLTRLPNRTLLLDRIEQALTRDRRAGVRTGVLFCDLDYFKQINDQFGHEGGDAVLRAVARRFARTIRASDTVARIGGDEFVVLIEAVSDLDEALLVADKLVLSLREPHSGMARGEPPLPGVSVGVAVSHEESTAESLLRDADAAMYHAKQTGRSRVEAAGSS
jgi:diguanylate cyclase (GGDEF)-like protein/PAS domain S-box-containing protein